MARPGCGGCGGIGTCEEVMECWCAQANHDQGLGCDDQNRPHVKIGHCLVFGPDGQISIDDQCLEERPAGPCEARVDLLPEFIVGGSSGGSPLTSPMGSPQALDYVVDHNIDFATCHSFSLVGGIASWSPYDGDQEMDRYSIVPSGVTGFACSVAEWQATTSDAGTTSSPTGRYADAPDSYKDPDGGWYGFYSGNFQLLTAGDAIRRVAGQTVLRFDVRAENPFGGFAADVDAILRSIQISCAQASSMILVPFAAVDQVEKIINAQVTPVVLVDADSDPEAISNAGGQWVEIEETEGDDQVQRFIDAGLQVLVFTGGWQSSTSKFQDMGARGVITGDPVYARGLLDTPSSLTYRRETQTWIRRGTTVGELTSFTAQHRVLDARGFTKQSEGGKYYSITDDRLRYDQLVGSLLPLEDPVSYSIELKIQVDGSELPENGSNSIGPRAGLVFGFESDEECSQDSETRNGYWAAVLVSSLTSGDDRQGILRLGKYVNGEASALADSSGTQPVEPNEWISLRLTVAGDQITWARTDGSGYEVTASDSDFRGAYFAIHASKSNDTDGSFVAGFTDVATVAVDADVFPGYAGLRRAPSTTVRVDDFDRSQASWTKREGM